MEITISQDEKNLVGFLEDTNLLQERAIESLVRVVRDPIVKEYHTYIEFRNVGKASLITGDSTKWREVQWDQKKRKIPTYKIGVSLSIPFEELNWLEEGKTEKDMEILFKEQLREALGKKQIDLLVNGVKEGSNIVRYGLMNQPKASKVSINVSTASVKQLVEAVVQAKEISIKKGSSNEKGFLLLMPYSLENKIKEYYNTAGTETGLSYLRNQYELDIIFSEYIRKPLFFQASTGDVYFHRFEKIAIQNTKDPHSGATRIFAQMAGAWLVVPFPERLVYLEV